MTNMRRWATLGLVLALGRVGAIAVIEPADETVRGSVPIKVDLGPGTDGGYVALYLGAASKPLRFFWAGIADKEGLFGKVWETQDKQANVADGEYRILAIGYSAANEVLGQASKTFEVQNKVPTSQLPTQGILLRYNLTPGRETYYAANTETTEIVAANEKEADKADLGFFRSGAVAHWKNRVLRRNTDGQAQVRNSIFNYGIRLSRGNTMPLAASQRYLTYGLTPLGELSPHRERLDWDFGYAEMMPELPTRPVKLGDTWRGKLKFLVNPRTGQMDTAAATSTLTSVQWYAGFRCALIETTYEAGPFRLLIDGEDLAGAAWSANTTMFLKPGKRTVYFAYQPEVGRVLRIDETQNCHFTLELEMEEEKNGEAGGGGAAAAAPAAADKPKGPAGWKLGGAALQPKNVAAAGGDAKDTKPIPFMIFGFNRTMRTTITQEYLESK